ncbi:hypothetical protein [Apibacter adventoris]|uniref:hypothetical protein n=1 Tax=Apibacter adventoris TaxID=1679466 RepID=UPI000CF62902|nr:hypothetical protein [Apibacter adventoris]PQL95199.1 hypothetical protein C4S76_03160 [Apibacter adventoris]
MKLQTSECAWMDFNLNILGRKIKGLRGFSFNNEDENELIYGAGNKPLDIQSGNTKSEGNIKILGFELDELIRIVQKFGYARIQDVPQENIVITGTFKKEKNGPLRIVTARGVKFSKVELAMEQGAKMMEVTLPFLAIDITTKII